MRCRLLAIIVALSCQPGILKSQESAGNSRTPIAQKKMGPKEVLAERFNWSAPQIGDQLPDLVAFDADGKSVRLHSLKGHFTVITFGCLT